MNKFIPYSRQSIDDDDVKAIVDVLRSDFITQGPKAGEFEEALAKYCGSRFAVVFSSGTAALHAAYFAAGVASGDEIITSPITFVATANAALYLGARPVFIDIEPDTGNINVELVERAITKKTKAIVPVHYAGHPVDLDPVHEIARRHNLLVIEDACHALGASYKGRKIGSLSDMSVFSFHPVKSITTGEGGAVLTDNNDYYEKLIMFRTHGVTKEPSLLKNEPHGGWYYEMQILGYNYRMTDIQAALGLSQLKKLDDFVGRRKKVAAAYNEVLRGNGWFDIPLTKEYSEPSWHLYSIRLKDNLVDRKREIFERLRQDGLGVQVHYIPVYSHPYYRSLGYQSNRCPLAGDFYHREISIPIHQSMGSEDVTRVVNVIRESLQGVPG